MPLLEDPHHPDGRLFGALVVRHSADAMLLLSAEGDILLANDAAVQLFGYQIEELRDGGRALIADDTDPEIAALAAARASKGSVRGEAWFTRKDGSRFRAELTSVTFEEEGRSRIVVIIRDVTERHLLDYQRRLISAAMNDSPQVICVIDADWVVLWANRATYRVSGYTPAQLIGQVAPMRHHLEAEDPDTLWEINRSLTSTGHWSGELSTRRCNREVYPLFGSLSRVVSPTPGQCHYITTLSDISMIRANERKLHDITHFDPVTGLPNSAHFSEAACATLRQALCDGEGGYVLMLDIDQFRDVIEAHGFSVADEVLRILTLRFGAILGHDTLLARHAGDTFTVMLYDPNELPPIEVVAGDLFDALKKPVAIESGEVALSMSMGVCAFPTDGSTVDVLLQNAQMAMNHAKKLGGNTIEFYDATSAHVTSSNLKTAAALRRAIENNELVAYFQPIVDSATFEVAGMEALVRWERPNGTVVGPGEFLDIAERAGLIGSIAESVLRRSCRHLLRLDQAGMPGLNCSVNLSASQFRDPDLPRHIIDLIESEGLTPERFTLEITENLLMDEPRQKQLMLDTLQNQGMSIVIDDFGTGYSSFGYLKHFTVNGIKLDRMFLEDVPGDVRGETLVGMLLSVGRDLDIPVVAEGVETRRHVDFLRRHRCERLQGFYVSHALSSDEFMVFVQNKRSIKDSVSRIY